MNKSLNIVALATLLLTCILHFSAYAATINIASYGNGTCTLANVQSAYDAASTGDTILFPSNGSCTWSSALNVSKAVTINGNGTTLTASGSMANGFFHITGFKASNLVRITGFTFQMTNWIPYCAIFVDNMAGGVSIGDIRIDNNTFHFGQLHVVFHHGKGLIDNNFFYNPIIATYIDAGSRANADESWVSLTAGTADALYIENNHFITDENYTLAYTQEQIGSENGGKLVIRYNEFNGDNLNTSRTYSPFQTHGNAAAGASNRPGYWQRDDAPNIRRGQSVVEFYNNTLHAYRMDFLAKLRGSANLVYNNKITSTLQYNPRIYLREEEYQADDWAVALRTAWPAEDQVHNTFIWNNTYKGVDFNRDTYGYVQSDPNANAGLLKDRDFFLHAPCGASDSTDGFGNTCTHGKATFTGLNGASGSYPTDGITYPTKGTMIFTSSGDNAYYGYTPYTYPHPLRGATTISGGISISGGSIQ